MKRRIVVGLERCCTATGHHFCPWLAAWSDRLDQLWGTGVWTKPAVVAERMEVALILAAYATGDEEWGRTAGWAEEFAHLVAVHPTQLAALIRSVTAEGVREPITLGHDGRVLDGHHRLLASVIAGREDIPVERFTEDASV